MASTPNRALRGATSPLRRFFDSRFRSVHEHVDVNLEQHLRPFLDRRLDAVETRIGWVDDRLHELKAELGAKLDRYDELERRLGTDAQTAAELAATFRRAIDGLAEELAAVRSAVERPADALLAEQVGTPLEELGSGGAALLNWAAGHRGPAAQAGLWFNPPVQIELGAGGARPGGVNERIVEVPYALAAVAALPAGSAVLDLGAAESTLALSLASLGFAVTALDLRPPPVAHPRLTPVVGPVEDWPGPDSPLDAILCVSTLEHVGLGAYGDPVGDDLDRRLVERFAGWLRPGGELVLTAPYGAWSVGEEERVYDRAHLEALLAGWQVLDRRVCVQTAPDRWEAAEGEPPSWMWDGGTRGVVLLRATPAG